MDGMNRVMNILAMILLACGGVAHGQDVKQFVAGILEQYPEARLLDIYKSCFQDYMGAEHLVSDTASARGYLQQELATTNATDLMPWYSEPCGTEGRHVRVSLRAVHEGLIPAETLLDAFMRSANGEHPDVESWTEQWHLILAVIDGMDLDMPHYAQDKEFIERILGSGSYAISHSPNYRETYNPHYRIVRRDIFEREIKPFLPCPCCL